MNFFKKQNKIKSKTYFAPTPILKKMSTFLNCINFFTTFNCQTVKSTGIGVSLSNKRGFAVLFAVLLASFLITLGISIFSISLKEIQIVTSSRDSQIAYYVADSALECADYWDQKWGAFPTCLDSSCQTVDINGYSEPTQPSFTASVACNKSTSTLVFNLNGSTYSTFNSNDGSNVVTNFFQASSTSSSTPVADISIIKKYDSTFSNPVITTMEVYGHNTSVLGRRVERGIQQVTN